MKAGVRKMENPKKLGDYLFSATFLVIFLILSLILCSIVLGLFIFIHHVDTPEPNVGNHYFKATETSYSSNALPIQVVDLGIDVLDYYYTQWNTMVYPFHSHSHCTESFVNTLEEPTESIILNYEIWESSIPFFLNRAEKNLQKTYGKKTDETDLNYGAEKAYWLGDVFVLRYEDKVICFADTSPVDMLRSEDCAIFMSNDFKDYSRDKK